MRSQSMGQHFLMDMEMNTTVNAMGEEVRQNP